MCCGDKRDEMKSKGSANENAVKLHYRGNGSAQIRGPVTGQIYQFPRHNPVQAVDPRDVSALIRTRLFAQVK